MRIQHLFALDLTIKPLTMLAKKRQKLYTETDKRKEEADKSSGFFVHPYVIVGDVDMGER